MLNLFRQIPQDKLIKISTKVKQNSLALEPDNAPPCGFDSLRKTLLT